jgi:hypothetical protein
MDAISTSASSSSADIAADLLRLIPPYEHEAFRVLLKMELNGRELPADEMRKAAVSAWHKLLKYGLPRT